MGRFADVELEDLLLSGPRVTLRPWQPGDADAVYAAMQDPAVHAFLPVPNPYTRADARVYVTELAVAPRRDGSGLECALVESDSGGLLGSAALRLPGPGRPEPHVGYWIAPGARGRGYATEATRVLAAWGLAHGVSRLELHCDVRNLASARCALAAGFRFEGVRRDYVRDGGPRHDLATFARLDTDPGTRVAPAFAALPGDGLTDGVVALRAVQPGDATAFGEQEADPVTIATGFTGVLPPAAEIERMCARSGLDWLVGSAAPFTIVDVASEAFAGSVRLRLAGPPNIGGVGYAVHPAFRGRGYTTRALKLLAPWAFGTAGFARLELGAKMSNIASQRAATAAGFIREADRLGRLRNPDGTFGDEARFYLLNPSGG